MNKVLVLKEFPGDKIALSQFIEKPSAPIACDFSDGRIQCDVGD